MDFISSCCSTRSDSIEYSPIVSVFKRISFLSDEFFDDVKISNRIITEKVKTLFDRFVAYSLGDPLRESFLPLRAALTAEEIFVRINPIPVDEEAVSCIYKGHVIRKIIDFQTRFDALLDRLRLRGRIHLVLEPYSEEVANAVILGLFAGKIKPSEVYHLDASTPRFYDERHEISVPSVWLWGDVREAEFILLHEIGHYDFNHRYEKLIHSARLIQVCAVNLIVALNATLWMLINIGFFKESMHGTSFVLSTLALNTLFLMGIFTASRQFQQFQEHYADRFACKIQGTTRYKDEYLGATLHGLVLKLRTLFPDRTDLQLIKMIDQPTYRHPTVRSRISGDLQEIFRSRHFIIS